MNMRDIGSYILPAVSILPQSSAAATVNGTGVNRNGYLSATLHAVDGAAAGAPSATSVVYSVQHSIDNGVTDPWTTATNVNSTPSGANLTMAALGASVDGRLDFDLTGLKEYIRAVATVSFTGGTTPSVMIAASFTLGGAYEKPTNYV